MNIYHIGILKTSWRSLWYVLNIQGFIQFCKDKDMENKITPTIAHDLNGTFDNLFLPRTTDYGKYTEKGA